MKMKEFLSKRSLLAGAVLVLVMVAGCAAPTPVATPTPEKIVIGWSAPSAIDPFQINLWDGMKATAEELGIELIVLDSENKVEKQAADMEDLILRNVDMIIVSPWDADAIIPSIEKANEAGIPVMTLDRGTNGGEIISHAAIDNYCFAYRTVELLAELMGGEGKLLYVSGSPGMTPVVWNEAGLRAALENYPDIELIGGGPYFTDWDAGKALAVTEDALTAHPDLDAIYCTWDLMTPGAVQALRARDLAGKVFVAGGGAYEDVQPMIEAGEVHFDVEVNTYRGGEISLKAAYDYLVNGIQPTKWTAWPLVMHTSEGETYDLDCPIPGWEPW